MSELIGINEGEGDERQTEAQYELAMETWAIRLNSMPEDQAEALKCTVIRELDSMCPYLNQWVYFTGRGIFPKRDENGIVIEDVGGQSHGMLGISQGVEVLRVTMQQGEEQYVVMHQFMVDGTNTRPHITEATKSAVLCFVEPGSSILPVAQIDEIYNSEPEQKYEEDVLQGVFSSSWQFSQLLRSKNFRRWTHKRQLETVSSFIEAAENIVQLRGKELLIDATYCYLPVIKDNFIERELLLLDDALIGGVCLGLESLERPALNKVPIRKIADITDKEAGLCMVIDPDFEIRQRFELNKDQLLFVPISSQALEFRLY